MKFKKLFAFLIIVTAIIICSHYFGWTEHIKNGDFISYLRNMVIENYIAAVFLYIFLTIIGCVLLALPGTIFAVFAAVLFNPWAGTAYCLIATTIGAMLAFLAGRFFLKDSLKPVIEKNKRLRRLLFEDNSKRDIVLLMITRLVPIFPYNLQNFAYGITDIRFSIYSIYTLIFMTPGVFFITFGAAGIVSGKNRLAYLIPAGLVCLLVISISIFMKRKYIDERDKKQN